LIFINRQAIINSQGLTTMQGKDRTRPTNDLGMIFWYIRTTRDTATRRSWQRRARLALAAIEWLTNAERHEIMCVWSSEQSHLTNSPALNKLLGRDQKSEYATRTPTLRASYTEDGQTKKKPSIRRLMNMEAANDSNGCTQDTHQRLQHLCTLVSSAYPERPKTQHHLRLLCPPPAQGDSDGLIALACGNPDYQHARREQRPIQQTRPRPSIRLI
jgi:hypothetical protein